VLFIPIDEWPYKKESLKEEKEKGFDAETKA
jgi:hypothetical protein